MINFRIVLIWIVVNSSFISSVNAFEIEKLVHHDVESSIRALEVVDDKTIWFAGSNGLVGHSLDGGETWKHAKVEFEGLNLEFRAIAVTENGVFILSVGSPGLLFRSQDNGMIWELMYREDHKNTFYDSIAFWDDMEGIAMGDPTEDCLSVIITRDSGENWNKLSCDNLPKTIKGEAAFAASNSNIALQGDNVWIVSGGKAARVFYSSDRGMNWKVADTPIAQGGEMTGIFSADFYDDKIGILFGGDWNDKSKNSNNKAIAYDGGLTWELLSDGSGPGYRSSLKFIPNSNAKEILAVGDQGISLSLDGGLTWAQKSGESFYTVRISPSGKSIWLAGANRVSKMLFKAD